MPTQLSLARHLDGLHEAVTAFAAYAGRAGLEAPVPTCPDWVVLDLLAHQGMVHRWATALVRGERPDDDEVAAFETAGRSAEDFAKSWKAPANWPAPPNEQAAANNMKRLVANVQSIMAESK